MKCTSTFYAGGAPREYYGPVRRTYHWVIGTRRDMWILERREWNPTIDTPNLKRVVVEAIVLTTNTGSLTPWKAVLLNEEDTRSFYPVRSTRGLASLEDAKEVAWALTVGGAW